jgi:putative tryptophan/tyrosine transport system substrate-binding protein
VELKRRELLVLLGGAPLWPLAAPAQQSKVHIIGVLSLTRADEQSFAKELLEGLREWGQTEGQTFRIESRSAEGNAARLPELAAELAHLKVDVIAAIFTPCALAAKQATTSIPIVMVSVGDPVGTGLVASLARPGSNITGLSNMGPETAGKSVELFRDMLPSFHRVGVLANPADPFTKPFLEQVQLAGRVSGIDIGPIAMVGSADEVDAAFADMVRARAQAVVVQGIFFSKAIADLAIKHRLPAASVLRSFAQAGGLVSYGAHTPDIFRRSAALVHKILQGAKPEDLPVEQPTKFELVMNLKTAKALGLTIPPMLLARADEVIE